jgi:hypothetical protein
MAKANIDIQVLVPSNGSFYYDVEPVLGASVCRSYNNAIGRMVKKYPGKFLGLATLPLQAPKLAVDVGSSGAPIRASGRGLLYHRGR